MRVKASKLHCANMISNSQSISLTCTLSLVHLLSVHQEVDTAT